MDRNLKLTVGEHVAASPADVWKALTDPDSIEKFMWGTRAKSEWKVGSPLTFEGVWNGKPYHEKGTILEMEPERVMQYSYLATGLADTPDNYAIITYRLAAQDGGTRVDVTQEGARDQQALEHSRGRMEIRPCSFEKTDRTEVIFSLYDYQMRTRAESGLNILSPSLILKAS